MAESAVIGAIRSKIAKLIKECDKLRVDNRKLAGDRDRLKAANRELAEKIAAMEKRIAVLELRDSMGGEAEGDDAKRARARVNRLMREVDKCIALLNK